MLAPHCDAPSARAFPGAAAALIPPVAPVTVGAGAILGAEQAPLFLMASVAVTLA